MIRSRCLWLLFLPLSVFAQQLPDPPSAIVSKPIPEACLDYAARLQEAQREAREAEAKLFRLRAQQQGRALPEWITVILEVQPGMNDAETALRSLLAGARGDLAGLLTVLNSQQTSVRPLFALPGKIQPRLPAPRANVVYIYGTLDGNEVEGPFRVEAVRP